MRLRPYQEQADSEIVDAWDAGAHNVLVVIPTGGGKTVLFARRVAEEPGAAVTIAHRQELVCQISLALSRWRVRHNIIGPTSVVKLCVRLQQILLGATYYDPGARKAVAGVDTLVRRTKQLDDWLNRVQLVVMDEGHHVLRNNKWGKAISLFKNARSLLVTATPERADKKGIHASADGIVDHMIVGPSPMELIEWGYLTPYRLFAPPSKVDMSAVDISKQTGDYNEKQMRTAVRRARVVGDVVEHFQRYVPNGRGITFLPDVEIATDQARQFQEAGVPAEVVSAKTNDRIRQEVLRRFERNEIRNMANVDLFGEGFDVPALDAVSMARPTQSLALYMQQCGRALRPMYAEGMPLDTVEQRREAIAKGPKPYAVIIDHVGNHERHGLPHADREWWIYGADKRRRNAPNDVIPTRTCLECLTVYERTHKVCPACGFGPTPQSRQAPEFVDGDLAEVDTGVLELMKKDVQRIDGPASVGHLSGKAAAGAWKQHQARKEAQKELREAMAWWAGCHSALGRSDSDIQRRFYFTFGVDVLSAQAFGRPKAEELSRRVWESVNALCLKHGLDVVPEAKEGAA